jgi:hypothetical protein
LPWLGRQIKNYFKIFAHMPCSQNEDWLANVAHEEFEIISGLLLTVSSGYDYMKPNLIIF